MSHRWILSLTRSHNYDWTSSNWSFRACGLVYVGGENYLEAFSCHGRISAHSKLILLFSSTLHKSKSCYYHLILDHTYVVHCFLNSTMNRPFCSPASKSHWNIPTLQTNKNKNKKQHSDVCLHPCDSSSQTRQWSIRRKEFIKFHGNFFWKIFSLEANVLSSFILQNYFDRSEITAQLNSFPGEKFNNFFLRRWVLWEMGILGYLENSCLKKMDLIKISF
jgi:hypothetical protein